MMERTVPATDAPRAVVVGGGLAGCEAALWLAGRGVRVTLYEQKPGSLSPAHKSPMLAELVCSNSLKAERHDSAGGLLKNEMRLLGSSLLPVAEGCRVAAGGALAVDRDAFAAGVTRLVEAHPHIELVREEVADLSAVGGGAGVQGAADAADGMGSAKDAVGTSPVIVATGPLTGGALAGQVAALAGGLLSFYDAAAPIVTADSIDMSRVFAASRYGRGDGDYLNCPLDKAEYEAFYAALLAAETAPLHTFDAPPEEGEDPRGAPEETLRPYEGCMPVEVMARRGPDTLRFGPMKPVGLTDPRTGRRPWACVQLRRENAEGTLYNLVGFQTNLKFGEQRRVFGLIPGLAGAEYARYGVMHRNTFLNSPAVLGPNLALKRSPGVFFAGQITGFEGYMESAACGLLAARAALAQLRGEAFTPPPAETMCGALVQYITAANKDFQPMGANMGLLPPLENQVRDKKQRYAALADRALEAMARWAQGGEAG